MKKGVWTFLLSNIFFGNVLLIAMDDTITSSSSFYSEVSSYVLDDVCCQGKYELEEQELLNAIAYFRGEKSLPLDISIFFPKSCICTFCQKYTNRLMQLLLYDERKLFRAILREYENIGKIYFGKNFMREHSPFVLIAYIYEQEIPQNLIYLESLFLDLGRFLVWDMIKTIKQSISFQDIVDIWNDILIGNCYEEDYYLCVQEAISSNRRYLVGVLPSPSITGKIMIKSNHVFHSMLSAFIRYFLYLGLWDSFSSAFIEKYNGWALIQNMPIITTKEQEMLKKEALVWCKGFYYNKKNIKYMQECALIFRHNEVMQSLQAIIPSQFPFQESMFEKTQKSKYIDVLFYTIKSH
jgi:hypothetical protein